MKVKSPTVTLDEHYFRWLESRRETAGICSEVVMVLPRPEARILTLTKSFYPLGTYNLPSGGMEPGETAEVAFAREVAEETGLEVGLCCRVGRVDHHCVFDDLNLEFTSHIMLGTQSDGHASARDAQECISGYLDASASDLSRFADHMRMLTGQWAGFGAFRATALDFVADYLAELPAL